LSFAAQEQQYGVIATIVERRHNHQDFDEQNRTPLHWLYQKYHDKGGYQQQPPRTKAMENILEYLGFGLQPVKWAGNQFKQDDYTCPNKLNESAAGGKTLLAYAVLNNYEELIDALWSRETGLSPDIPNDDDGTTAASLHWSKPQSDRPSSLNIRCFGKTLKQLSQLSSSSETLQCWSVYFVNFLSTRIGGLAWPATPFGLFLMTHLMMSFSHYYEDYLKFWMRCHRPYAKAQVPKEAIRIGS
jgi:hypothetical protein